MAEDHRANRRDYWHGRGNDTGVTLNRNVVFRVRQ